MAAVLIGGVGQISIEVWIIRNGRSLGHDECFLLCHYFRFIFTFQFTSFQLCSFIRSVTSCVLFPSFWSLENVSYYASNRGSMNEDIYHFVRLLLLRSSSRLLLMYHSCYSILSAFSDNTPHYCDAIWFVFAELYMFLIISCSRKYERFLCSDSRCSRSHFTHGTIQRNKSTFTLFQLLQLCKKRSRKHYATIFVKESLNARFEVENGPVWRNENWIKVKGVIELTTVLIPICTSALAVKGLLFILNFVSSFGENNLVHDAHFLLRIVSVKWSDLFTRLYFQASLIYGIIYPFMLIFRVKTLRRRFSKFVPSSKIAIYLESSLVEESAETSTKKYFQHLSNQWNE